MHRRSRRTTRPQKIPFVLLPWLLSTFWCPTSWIKKMKGRPLQGDAQTETDVVDATCITMRNLERRSSCPSAPTTSMEPDSLPKEDEKKACSAETRVEMEPEMTARKTMRDPERPAPRPIPHANLRANLVRKVAAFTAARSSRCFSAPLPLPRWPFFLDTPPTVHAARFDDPFMETSPAALPASPHFVPAHPAALRFPSLQRFRPDQQQSPTPQPRMNRPPTLRLSQLSIPIPAPADDAFRAPSANVGIAVKPKAFYCPSSPRRTSALSEFWTPHPAGSQSCAIAIKAPPPRANPRSLRIRRIPLEFARLIPRAPGLVRLPSSLLRRRANLRLLRIRRIFLHSV
ncbi:hypothetical protein B0H10DRAFT_835767 [Mycena sp. CBHHK59/15]|nr:hypothetical protein B0H10DRAFT_835767 [Mycena sp. CBHHK59/15]